MSYYDIQLRFEGVTKADLLDYLFLGHGLKLTVTDEEKEVSEINLRSLDEHSVDSMDLEHKFDAIFSWKEKDQLTGHVTLNASGKGPFSGFIDARIEDGFD